MGTDKINIGQVPFINGIGHALFRTFFIVDSAERLSVTMTEEGALEQQITALPTLLAFTVPKHNLLQHIVMMEIAQIETSDFTPQRSPYLCIE